TRLHGAENAGSSSEMSTSCTLPSNDTKYQVSSRRTAFSMTGSAAGSKNGSLRRREASLPWLSSAIVIKRPSPHIVMKLESPDAYVSAQPGVATSSMNVRDSTSTTVTDCAGVKL